MYLLLFFYPDNQSFDIIKIDKIVFAEVLTKKNDPIRKLFDIILLVILHGPYRNENLNALCIKISDYGLPQYIQ